MSLKQSAEQGSYHSQLLAGCCKTCVVAAASRMTLTVTLNQNTAVIMRALVVSKRAAKLERGL